MAFTSSDDLNILQASDSTNVGAGAGNDTYIVNGSSTTNGQTINITDTEGTNTIKLIDGVTVTSSTVAATSLQLVLSNGATINILGADSFNFETGGDAFTTGSGTVANFSTFVTGTLGVAAVPTGSDTAAGTANTVIGSATTTTTAQTFTLTTNPDAFTGGTGDDLFVTSEATLSSADVIDGGLGSDTLRYASSGSANVSESGFASSNIETIQVTSDVASTFSTTFDMTGVSGETKVINNNSSNDLALVGMSAIVDLELTSIGGATAASAGAAAIGSTTDADTLVTYTAAAVAGSSDTQNITLNGNLNSDGSNVGDVTIAGIETLSLTTTGAASEFNAFTTGATTVNIAGDQNLKIDAALVGATAINASTFTGNLSVVADSGSVDTVVTGNTGDDTADFSAGFDAGDSFNGGDGTDTLALSNSIATGTPGGAVSNVEQLAVSDAASGTIDMDNFSSISKVILDGGMGGDVTISDAVTGLSVEVDQNTATTDDLTIALKTDGSSDEVTVLFDDINDADAMGVVTVNDAETLNLNGSVLSTGSSQDLTIAKLTATDATTLNIVSDAAIDLTDADTTGLTTVTATSSTGDLDLENLDLASAGATVTLGSGDDTILSGAGADTLTGNGGADTFKYTAASQSDNAGTDTIKDFVSGTDIIDLKSLAAGAVTSSSQFKGVFGDFGSAQGALTGSAGTQGADPGLGDAVFEANFDGSGNGRLWVDIDGDGTLSNTDLRIILEGVSTIAVADLGLGLAGVTYTANATGFNTATASQSNENNVLTTNDDTINATAAQIVGATVDGLASSDTLNITTQVTGTLDLEAGNIANIEAVNLKSGSSALVTILNGADITTTTSAASTVTLGTGGQVFTGGSGSDVVGSVALDDKVSSGSGDDQVTLITGALTGTFDGGADTDTLILVNASNLSGATVSNFENLTVATAASMTTSQWDALNDGTVTAGATTDTITLTDAGTVDTVAAVGGYTATAALALTVNVGVAAGGAYILTGSSAADTFNLNAGFDGADSVVGGLGADVVNLNFDTTGIDFTTAPSTAIPTLNITANQTGTIIVGDTNTTLATINASTLTTGLTLTNGLTGGQGALTISTGSGNDTVSAVTDATAAMTINFGSGNDTLSAISASTANTNIITLQFGTSATGNIDSNTIATGGNSLVTGDIIDIDGVTLGALATTLAASATAGIANTMVVTNDTTDSVLSYDANGNGVLDAGSDFTITVTGQVLTTASFNLVSGDLVIA